MPCVANAIPSKAFGVNTSYSPPPNTSPTAHSEYFSKIFSLTFAAASLSATLVIYLFKWYGVIGVALFTLCAVAAKQKKTETPVKGFLASLEAGIGIVLIVVIVLMLLRSC